MDRKKLVFVARCDFRCSEVSIYNEAKKQYAQHMKPGDVMLFVSFTGNQVMWVSKPSGITNKSNAIVPVFESRRWRLPKSQEWNPLMIADYAEHANISLIGLKKYKDYVKSLAA